MTSDATTTVKLISSDGKEFHVPRNIVSMSVALRSMIEDYEESEECPDLPVENVSAEVLEKVLEYCKYHVENESLAQEQKEKWDSQFVKMPDRPLFSIILAANYLDIKPLLDLCTKAVAMEIKSCKTPEEIKKRYNITRDPTEEEKTTIMKEYDWVFREIDRITESAGPSA